MAFYSCPKCKKVWQYPIEKCPQCFSILEQIKSQKNKVIGISKVNITTLLHPKASYFVLLLEDENGNRWVQKSSQEYKIGDFIEFRTTSDKRGVAVWRIKYDISESVKKVIELLGGLNLNSETKVLILPTLVSPKHPYFAENTSPQFLEAAIRYLIEKGAKPENITVGAQSFDEIPMGAAAQKSQLLEVCQNFKVLPLDLATKNFIKKDDFEISEEILNKDLIVNLPILKVGKISATENILKVLKKESYLGLKYLSSDEEIIKGLSKILNNVFTLAEANRIQKSDELCANLGLVLASFNFLNLERVFFEITLEIDLPEILKEIRIEDIPIFGRQIVEVQYNIQKYG